MASKEQTERWPLEWALWPWQRCRAVKEPGFTKYSYFGRCDLKKGHKGYHALERGMDTPMWSTEWLI